VTAASHRATLGGTLSRKLNVLGRHERSLFPADADDHGVNEVSVLASLWRERATREKKFRESEEKERLKERRLARDREHSLDRKNKDQEAHILALEEEMRLLKEKLAQIEEEKAALNEVSLRSAHKTALTKSVFLYPYSLYPNLLILLIIVCLPCILGINLWSTREKAPIHDTIARDDARSRAGHAI